MADRASSYSRVVDEGKVKKSGAVSFGFFEACHGCSTVPRNVFCYDGGLVITWISSQLLLGIVCLF